MALRIPCNTCGELLDVSDELVRQANEGDGATVHCPTCGNLTASQTAESHDSTEPEEDADIYDRPTLKMASEDDSSERESDRPTVDTSNEIGEPRADATSRVMSPSPPEAATEGTSSSQAESETRVTSVHDEPASTEASMAEAGFEGLESAARDESTVLGDAKRARGPADPSERSPAPKPGHPDQERRSGGPEKWVFLVMVGAVAAWWYLKEPTAPTETPREASDAPVTQTLDEPSDSADPRTAPPAPSARGGLPGTHSPDPAPEPSSPDALSEEAPSEPSIAPGPTASTQAQPSPVTSTFDAALARASLNEVAREASGCRQRGDPRGTTEVVVTFAPSGRVKSARIYMPPFVRTNTSKCIEAAMRKAQVAAFSGKSITLIHPVFVH